jgi:hypothetical protein
MADAVRVEVYVSVMDFEIPGSEKIRLYADRAKSLRIILRHRTIQGPDMDDNDFWTEAGNASEDDPIDVIQITPDTPFVLVVEGVIYRESGSDEIIFDFNSFGSLRKKSSGGYFVEGYWKPIRPPPGDSGENYTKIEYFDVVESKK